LTDMPSAATGWVRCGAHGDRPGIRHSCYTGVAPRHDVCSGSCGLAPHRLGLHGPLNILHQLLDKGGRSRDLWTPKTLSAPPQIPGSQTSRFGTFGSVPWPT